ncbi:uncharacterized protein METZ01_LOCUS177749, partial [marine metagenome]
LLFVILLETISVFIGSTTLSFMLFIIITFSFISSAQPSLLIFSNRIFAAYAHEPVMPQSRKLGFFLTNLCVLWYL